MKYYNTIYVVLLFTFLYNSAHIKAQNFQNQKPELSIDEGTIANKFDYIFKKSGNYRNFKVINRAWLETLKLNTIDSLNGLKVELNEAKTKIETQTKAIENLNSKLKALEFTLNDTLNSKDRMSVFGLQMSKFSYSLLLWTVISILLLTLGFYIYKFITSNIVTKRAKSKLVNLEEEYEDYRKIALEREQKVRRQLQDEINKNTKGKSK